MELFWKNLETTQVLLEGSSRMEMGMDPDAYPEWNMLNTAVSGIDGNRDMYFVKNYAFNHSDHLKESSKDLSARQKKLACLQDSRGLKYLLLLTYGRKHQ